MKLLHFNQEIDLALEFLLSVLKVCYITKTKNVVNSLIFADWSVVINGILRMLKLIVLKYKYNYK